MMGRLKTGRPSFNFAPDSIAILAAKPSVLRRAIGGLIATMPFYCSAVSMTSASQKAEKLALAFAVHNVIESGLLCFQSAAKRTGGAPGLPNEFRGTKAMDALELILARCSPMQLVEPGPDRDQLDMILRAAIRAPDHGRMRPWRFLSIQGDARRRLGDLMMQSLERREPTIEPTRLNSERDKSMRAPLIIAVAAAVRAHPKVPDIEQIVAVGAAVQNMILAAHALGFGAFWRTGPAAYDSEVKEALGFSASDSLVGFIYLGSIGKAGKVSPADLSGLARQWWAPSRPILWP